MDYRLFRTHCLLLLAAYFFSSCSPYRQINKSAKQNVLATEAFATAHTGISIFEPATGRYWYNYQGDKYFVPASNTKLFTCYAAMKYLGDSIIGMNYEETDDVLLINPTGDPTFLHPDFVSQPVYDFLRSTSKTIALNTAAWQDERWGSGWSWNDYSEYYMAERSVMPMYGNVIRFSDPLNRFTASPGYFNNKIIVNGTENTNTFPSSVERAIASNEFFVTAKNKSLSGIETPFYTGDDSILINLLSDTLQKSIYKSNKFYLEKDRNKKYIYSQPTDSLLKPMMHRSDNFFAEQSLLMVSNKLLGLMNDAKVIDTILKTEFKDLPQKPRWVDGSGLSRYNLFTPQDFVAILTKMKNEFGMDRLKNILATGGEGTISNYYKADSGYIFAKTGTLSGVVAFSGFLYTKKNKLLVFSVLVNNHQGSSAGIRRAVEKFLEGVRNGY
jgi:serine-type D-Ala-D-Ala carboxypeptidase/endopeptidase (penicillin-binding protein 4)